MFIRSLHLRLGVYRFKDLKVWIRVSCPEPSCLCPRAGMAQRRVGLLVEIRRTTNQYLLSPFSPVYNNSCSSYSGPYIRGVWGRV